MRDIVLGESDLFLVGLIFESPHFVKSSFGVGFSENDNAVTGETIDSGAHRHS